MPEYLELLRLHYEYSLRPSELENEEKLDYFCELTKKNHFMPSVWLLTRLSLNPNGPVSPWLIMDMLCSFETTHIVNTLVLTAFVLNPDDANLALEYDEPGNHSDYHQALWIFSSLFSKHRLDYWPGHKNDFSPELQQSLSMALKQSLIETKDKMFTGARDELRDFMPTRTPEEKAAYRQMEKLMSYGMGVDNVKSAESDPDLSSYQRNIAGLILAWHLRQDFISREANPLKCAALLNKVASRGHFKLLYSDAATLFATFGHYDDALKSLDQLLCQPLSPDHKDKVMHQYEAYSLAKQATSPPRNPVLMMKMSGWLARLRQRTRAPERKQKPNPSVKKARPGVKPKAQSRPDRFKAPKKIKKNTLKQPSPLKLM